MFIHTFLLIGQNDFAFSNPSPVVWKWLQAASKGEMNAQACTARMGLKVQLAQASHHAEARRAEVTCLRSHPGHINR